VLSGERPTHDCRFDAVPRASQLRLSGRNVDERRHSHFVAATHGIVGFLRRGRLRCRIQRSGGAPNLVNRLRYLSNDAIVQVLLGKTASFGHGLRALDLGARLASIEQRDGDT
jgi:hypothetical protein